VNAIAAQGTASSAGKNPIFGREPSIGLTVRRFSGVYECSSKV
jgi:hypothetical protein